MYKATITITTDTAFAETATITVDFDPPIKNSDEEKVTTVEAMAVRALRAITDLGKLDADQT